MEERRSEEQAGQDTGACVCQEFAPPNPLPGEGESVRRLIKALEEELEWHEPTDATKKFADELKDADKEYRGVADVVSKYEEFYDKLDGLLATARGWRKDIREWCEAGVDPETRAAIRTLRRKSYDAKEREQCCQALDYADRLSALSDCRGQWARREEEAQADYKQFKEFEKSVNDRFGALKSLFDQAKGHRDKERNRAVCAVALEFNEVYSELGVVRTADYWRSKCRGSRGGEAGDYGYGEEEQGEYEGEETDVAGRGAQQQSGGQQSESRAGGGASSLKRQWPPARYRRELAGALRRLIMTKYQRFRYQQQWYELDANAKKFRDACDKFRASRREEFVQEAEDVGAGQ